MARGTVVEDVVDKETADSINLKLKQWGILKAKFEVLAAQDKQLAIKIGAMKKEIDVLETEILGKMNEAGTTHWASKYGLAKVDESKVYSCEDYEKLQAYIVKYKAWDLLQKRLSQTAIRARLEDKSFKVLNKALKLTTFKTIAIKPAKGDV